MTATKTRLTADADYAAHGIVRRAPRQHQDKPLMPYARDQRHGLPAGSQFEVVGHFDGSDGEGYPFRYEALVVTLTNGTKVPAYRRGENFAICQNFGYKAVIAKAAK